MKKIDTQIETLIISYLENACSCEDEAILYHWLQDDVDNVKLFFEIKSIHNLTNPSFHLDDLDLMKAMEVVGKRIKTPKTHKKSLMKLWQHIASVAIIPLLCITIYALYSKEKVENKEIVYQEVISPPGMRSQVNLPDGSQVWLNSKSSIKFPADMSSNPRQIMMQGEVYFSVKSDSQNPFVVKTSHVDVIATGTMFNVEAYAQDSIVAITLSEGVVDVRIDNQQTNLAPKDRLVYNRLEAKQQVYTTDTFKWAAWKDGILAFRDDELKEVIKKIGTFYNVHITLKDKSLENHIYRATFKDESLEEILYLLKASAPIDYKEVKTGSSASDLKREIVIFKK